MCREIALNSLKFVSTEFSNRESTRPLWWQSYADKSQNWGNNKIDDKVVWQTAHTFQNMGQSPKYLNVYWLLLQ